MITYTVWYTLWCSDGVNTVILSPFFRKQTKSQGGSIYCYLFTILYLLRWKLFPCLFWILPFRRVVVTYSAYPYFWSPLHVFPRTCHVWGERESNVLSAHFCNNDMGLYTNCSWWEGVETSSGRGGRGHEVWEGCHHVGKGGLGFVAVATAAYTKAWRQWRAWPIYKKSRLCTQSSCGLRTGMSFAVIEEMLIETCLKWTVVQQVKIDV